MKEERRKDDNRVLNKLSPEIGSKAQREGGPDLHRKQVLMKRRKKTKTKTKTSPCQDITF